jgi:hypothetical protein
MKIGGLTQEQLQQWLGGSGLRVIIGPFIFFLRTTIPAYIADFGFAYADFPICDQNEVCDFRVRLAPAPSWRPWREARAEFWVDGFSLVRAFPAASPCRMPWGLNGCIFYYAHQFLMFHSAVVEEGWGRAAILAGPGSGKSTLCVALLARGWRLRSTSSLCSIRPAVGCGRYPDRSRLKGLYRVGGEIAAGMPDRFDPLPTHGGKLAHLRPPTDAVERQEEPARPAG